MGTGGGRNSTGVWLTGLRTHTLRASETLEVEILLATFIREVRLLSKTTQQPGDLWLHSG